MLLSLNPLYCPKHLKIFIPFVLVAAAERVEVSPEERVSVVEITTIEQREERVKVVVDTKIDQVLDVKQVVALPPAVREIEDDWFVLLDVPTREPSYVPPGIGNFHSRPTIKTCKLVINVLQYSFIILFVISYKGRVCSGLS